MIDILRVSFHDNFRVDCWTPTTFKQYQTEFLQVLLEISRLCMNLKQNMGYTNPIELLLKCVSLSYF